MNSGRSNISNKRDLDGERIMDMERSRLLMEQENEERLQELKNKMSSLKGIAVDIDGEVKTQNHFLDEMGDGMSNATNGMKKTLNSVGKMLSNADQPTLIVIVLVIVLAFIIVWKFLSKK